MPRKVPKGLGLVLAMSLAPPAFLARSQTIDFALEYVDTGYGGSGKPGWVRSGDMDGDGDVDLVAAGGGAMFIYENDGTANPVFWPRRGNLSVSDSVNANGGALLDVDRDGDLDVISAPDELSLGWWENPGGPLQSVVWAFHPIASVPSGTFFLHDLILVDVDGDGVARELITNRDASYWSASILIRWHREQSGGGWESHAIESGRSEGPEHGHAGLDLADLDADGDPDLAYANGWYENTGDPTESWSWHPVTDVYGISNTLARDVNGDGRLDLVVSAGHHGQGVYWLEQPASNPASEAWLLHPISVVDGDPTARWFYDADSPALHHPESLQVLDLDGDGDLDVITTELFFGEDPGEPAWDEEKHHVFVYRNDGSPTSPSWSVLDVAPDAYPSHLAQIADLNQDGRPDFISEGAGYGVISYYRNLSEPGSVLPLLVGISALRWLESQRKRRSMDSRGDRAWAEEAL
jgi:hypothetical protein